MSDEITFDAIAGLDAYPLIVFADDREVLRVTPDRRLIIAPDVTVDEAARGFVDAVNKLFAAYGEAVSPTTGTAA